MLLVMISVLIAGVLSVSFLASQSTTTTIAQNVERHAEARGVAESGLSYAVAYLQETADWRDTLTPGQAFADVAFPGGVATIRFDDATNDFTDDTAEPALVRVVGEAGGVTHRVEARVAPTASTRKRLLLIHGSGGINPQDAEKQSLFESWGYDVIRRDHDESSSELLATAADVDVVYISESVTSHNVNTKLRETPTGVVSGEGYLIDDFGLSASDSSVASGVALEIVDASHPITAGFELGRLDVALSMIDMRTFSELRGDPDILAESASGRPTLIAADVSTSLDTGVTAGRRVLMPFGDNGWRPGELNEDGLTILRQALIWASSKPTTATDSVAHYTFAEQSGNSVRDTAGVHNLDMTLFKGNGRLTWVDDPEGGTGLFFDQNPNNGTAVLRSSTEDAADPLMDQIRASRAFTVQVLLRPDRFGGRGGRIVTSSSDTGFHSRNFSLSGDGNGRWHDVETHVRQSTSVAPTSLSRALDRGEIVVLTWSVDVNKTYHNNLLYINGERVVRGSTWGDFANWTSEYLLIGNEATLDRPFRGTIYDLQIFDRALSAAEATANADAMLAGATTEPNEPTPPTCIVSYDFQQPPDTLPTLIAHWPLDEAAQAVGSLAVHEVIDLTDDSLIDAYLSILGPYRGPEPGVSAVISTNDTSRDAVMVLDRARVIGDLYIGPGGDIDRGVRMDSTATVTGDVGVMAQSAELMPPLPPSLSGRARNEKHTRGQYVIDSDQRFRKWDLLPGAEVTIEGDVRIEVTEDMTMRKASILVPQGSSLELYVRYDLDLRGDAVINPDTSGPERVLISAHGMQEPRANDGDIYLHDDAILCGEIHSNSDVQLFGRAAFYGSMTARDDIRFHDNSAAHIDALTRGATPIFAQELRANLDGVYRHGAIGGAEGHDPSNFAAAFDGVDDFIEVSHDDAFLLDRGTISFWFYAEDLSGNQGLVSKDSNGLDDGGHVTIWIDGGQLRYRLQEASGGSNSHVVSSSNGAVSRRTWHHVAATFGPAGMRLYLDGARVGERDYTGGLGPSSGGRGNHEPWIFGADARHSRDNSSEGWRDPFHGRLDEVRLYANALSDGQVTALAVGEEPGPETSYFVSDVSAFGDPLDLEISDSQAVRWIDGGALDVTGEVRIASGEPASKIHAALTSTDEITLEAVFTPANLGQDGPARIVSMSEDASRRNFTLGQADADYEMRLRTTETSSNGTPEADAGVSFVDGQSQHVIISYSADDGLVMRRNGALERELPDRGGSFTGWDDSMRLILANEFESDRHWRGRLSRVAIYDRAVDRVQAERMFDGSDPGLPGSEDEVSLEIVWVEGP
ncbi:MAG: LamG-like jellyroll fold domain-containing protein [Phycisphaeraceae bacterium]